MKTNPNSRGTHNWTRSSRAVSRPWDPAKKSAIERFHRTPSPELHEPTAPIGVRDDAVSERIGLLLSENLCTKGLVPHWRSQPLNLLEMGEPTSVPDLLAEHASAGFHVIEIKAKRILDGVSSEKLALERSFLTVNLIYRAGEEGE